MQLISIPGINFLQEPPLPYSTTVFMLRKIKHTKVKQGTLPDLK